jgi:hypothetical protein
MKKTKKKLVLAKETMLNLDAVSLEQARGGSVTCPTVFGWAGCWSDPDQENN